MSNTKKITVTVISLITVIGISVACTVYLITRPTEMEGNMRPVETDISVEYSLNNKLRALEEAIEQKISSGIKGEIQLILNEDEVGVLLVKMMQDAMLESTEEFSDGMVIDSKVNIDFNEIKAIVDIEVYGIPVKAGAFVQAIVDDRGISLLMYDLEIGQLPFAGSIEERIEDKFNQTHNDMKLEDLHIDIDKDLPVKLKNLVLGNREMIIIGEIT